MGDAYRRSVKIFIGGLSFETTDEALKRYFEQFGPVADAIVMKDAVSRRSRGFGFITYMNAASVDAALSVEQHIVDNRRVEAKRAVPRSEVPKMDANVAASPLLQPAHGAWEGSFGMDGPLLRGMPDSNRTRSNSTVSASSMGGITGMEGAPMACKIFVGGLHYETRDASLQAYFEQFGPVAAAEVMFNRETHKSRGFGFVVFEHEEAANAVLQSSHHTVNGKVVEVKRAVPRSQSSVGGSNPSSPALMGFPPSPSALGPGAMGKPAKRAQRARAPRDHMLPGNSSLGHQPPAASPQHQRYTPATSYAAALRYGAGRQQHSGLAPHAGGKPPQHHGHLPGRDDLGGFRLHGPHSSFLPPGAAARAEAAAAHAFVRELKAWDVENPGGGLNFDDSFDYYPEPRSRGASGDHGSFADLRGGEGSFSASFSGGAWPNGEGLTAGSRAWGPSSHGSGSRSQYWPSRERPRIMTHSGVEGVSPRHGDHFSSVSRQGQRAFSADMTDTGALLYHSPSLHEDDYRNGHGRKSLGELHSSSSRQLSPGEAGGTPARMNSSPTLGGGGLFETAFAELSLDGTGGSGLHSTLGDGVPPNGDHPSLLSELGGGGPPSTTSEVLPYGRTGGETAPDGGDGDEGLGSRGLWRADAFGSALGVNVPSTASEGKDLSRVGVGEHYMGQMGSANTDTAPNLGWS